MDEQLESRLRELETKVDAVYISVEKTRKYFQIVLWVTVIAVVLPLVGLFFAIPSFMGTIDSYSTLGI